MISFDIMHFDQTNLLFLLLSAVGLVRERRMLPFLVVLLGNLIHGPIAAVFLASFIVWHRMDFARSRWIQLKDVIGFMLILIGAIATGPFQQISVFFGVLFLSFSFGRGSLGVIPGLLLLRQYIPHPEPLEIILGAAAAYWVILEAIYWSKTSRESVIKGIIETLCTLGVLFGLRDYGLKIVEDPGYIALASLFVLIPLLVFVWVQWKGERFFAFFHRSRKSLARSIGLGNYFISDQNPWVKEGLAPVLRSVESSFNRMFTITFSTLVLLIVFFILSRGGLS